MLVLVLVVVVNGGMCCCWDGCKQERGPGTACSGTVGQVTRAELEWGASKGREEEK